MSVILGLVIFGIIVLAIWWFVERPARRREKPKGVGGGGSPGSGEDDGGPKEGGPSEM